MPNRPTQLSLLFAGARKLDGSLFSNGVVYAYDANAIGDIGGGVLGFVYRRAYVFRDPEGGATWGSPGQPDFGEIELDANGAAKRASVDVLPGVYADGNIRLEFYAEGSTLPDGSEEGKPTQSNGAVADRLELFFAGQEIVNVRHFGAKGDAAVNAPGTGTDDTIAIQAAIDYCLGVSYDPNKAAPSRPRILLIPQGVYRITKALRIWSKLGKAPQDTFDYVCIQIHGELRNLGSDSKDAVIFCDSTQEPAIMIQGGLGVVIKHLALVGVNAWDLSFNLAAQQNANDYTKVLHSYLDDRFFNYDWSLHNWFPLQQPYPLSGTSRDNMQSPNAGIVIDPFGDEGPNGADVPVPRRYPGFDNEYTTTTFHYSSGITIEGCHITRFVVGIMISPHGFNYNAENVVIRETQIVFTRVALAVAQSQTRGLHLESSAISFCHTAVDTLTYGRGTEGTPPNIRGLAVSAAKYLFQIGTGTTTLDLTQIYCEVTLSIGAIAPGQTPSNNGLTFAGCHFDLYLTRPMIDTHLSTFGGLTFVGCLFKVTGGEGTGEYPPVAFSNRGPLHFVDCSLRSGRPGPASSDIQSDLAWLNGALAWGFHDPSLVTIDNVNVSDSLLADQGPRLSFLRRDYPTNEGSIDDVSYAGGFARHHVPPGARIGPSAAAFGTVPFFRVVTGKINEIVLGTVTLVYLAPDGLQFSGFAGLLLPGDVVYNQVGAGQGEWSIPVYARASTSNLAGTIQMNPTSGYPAAGPIGVISSATSGVNVIRHIPKSLADKFLAAPGNKLDLQLRVKRFGRYHPKTRGDLTAGSQIITNVTAEGMALTSAWKKGDRITSDHPNAQGMPVIARGTYVLAVTTSGGGQIQMSRVAPVSATGIRLFDADVARYSGTVE